jgi:hypothetical protein
VRGHDSDVGVGRDLEGGETTSNDGSADDETGKDGLRVVGTDGKVSDRPEEDSTDRVESETRNDGKLVSSSFEDFTSDGGVSEVTDTEVGGLETSGLGSGDVQGVLEVLVELKSVL